MRTRQEFMEYIGRDDQDVIYRRYWKKPSGETTMVTVRTEKVEYWNQTGCIYYIPSIGGTKTDEISEHTVAFVEWDAGRPTGPDGKPIKGAYFEIEVVDQLKAVKLEELRSFPLPLTIFESRNGFHAYIALTDRPSTETWILIQRKLWSLFGGDWHTEQPHQPMRAPFTWWRKKGYEPFFFGCVEHHGTRCSSLELLEALKDVEPRDRPIGSKSAHTTTTRTCERTTVESGHSDYIEAIRSGDVSRLRELLKPIDVQVSTYQEAIDLLTRDVPLGHFLGAPATTLRCPFHADTRPSASIFQLDSKEWFFKCHGCGIRGNIRAIVQEVQGVTHARAMDYLMEVFGVTIAQSEWQIEQRRNLEGIKRVIHHELMAHYPVLHQNVAKDLLFLSSLIDVAIDNIYDQRYTTPDGEMVFFASMRHLARVFGVKHHKTASRKVINLTLHRLIRRLDESEVPGFLIERADRHRTRRDGIVVGNRISFFSVPMMSPRQLLESENIAMVVKEKGLSKEGYSYDGIYRTFGPEVANSIFLGRDREGPTPGSDSRTRMIHETAMEMIEQRGWVRAAEIEQRLTAAWMKTRSSRQMKNCLPELLESYGLECVWLTKEMKDELGITEPGYWKIIRRKKVETGDDVLRMIDDQQKPSQRG